MAKLFFCVFIGGGLGSVSRYGVALLLGRWIQGTFPVATLAVNIIGSLLIGALWASPMVSGREVYAKLLIVGFCGGFTTFSAFSWENLDLIRQGSAGLMAAYAAVSVVVCLLATWGGYAVARAVFN